MPNIMYHFIGGDENLKGISLRNFKAQLDSLQKTYPQEELVLTFDHGTIDHLHYAAPELERRGLKGIFFILTMVQEEYHVAAIDKQRFLEAKLRLDLAKMICATLKIDYRPQDARDYLSAFSFYSMEERYIRYLRDKIISEKDYDGFIETIFNEVFGNEKAFALQNYLSWDHVVELHKRGHTIGAHAHYHIGDGGDYARAIQLIEGKIKAKVECVSYPNGVKRISDEELRSLGIRKAYISTENGTEPFRIGRIDCNQEPFTPLSQDLASRENIN